MQRDKIHPLMNVMLDFIVMVMLFHQTVEHLFQITQKHVQLVIFVQHSPANPNPVHLVSIKVKLGNESVSCVRRIFIVR